MTEGRMGRARRRTKAGGGVQSIFVISQHKSRGHLLDSGEVAVPAEQVAVQGVAALALHLGRQLRAAVLNTVGVGTLDAQKDDKTKAVLMWWWRLLR